jgi:beta-phosphoglucomutase-like phosphatase (HAD superfamily)
MEDVTRGKPDPEVFVLGAMKLGIPPERCIVLEDAPVGIQAAKAGGMRAVGVTFVGHHSAATLTAAGADWVVGNLEEVTIARLIGLVAF